MGRGDMPTIWTPQEVADYLKVSEAAVVQEWEKGSLQGFKVGAEWRCSDLHLQEYVSRGQAKKQLPESEENHSIDVETDVGFHEVEPFDFAWPRRGGQRDEHYSRVYETTRRVDGQQFTFKVGFGEREVAARLRARVVVWLESRALVEFAGGNTYEVDGLLASLVKLADGKQVSTRRKVPSEYASFQIARYNSIVQGPYASGNFAIVVHKDDLESMVRHALIRAQRKGLV